jgi:hypothetical protein
VAYNPADLRLERVSIEVAYDAAFLFWNLRGVIAERWGHGPVFGAMGEAQNQVNLSPAAEEGVDARIQGVYGLKASALLAEGPDWTAQARGIAEQWFPDVFDVLAPRKTVRMNVQLFGLYPLENAGQAVQASRRMRSRFYRNDNLLAAFPDRLAEQRDSLHAAINWIAIEEGRQNSLIAGIVGPVHAGLFFTYPKPERDEAWWVGVNLTLSEFNTEDGIEPEVERLQQLVADAYADYDSVSAAVLREVIP